MLAKVIGNRLRAGALVVLVEEPDEALAIVAAKAAGTMFTPVTVVGGADPEVMQAVERHKSGQGTLIITDFLRVYGTNPVATRMVREIALQERGDGNAYSRLILIEAPGVEVPSVLKGDIEFVKPKLPSLEELTQELDSFLDAQKAKLEGNGESKELIASAVTGLSRHEAARLFARCWIENTKLDSAWLRREKAGRVAERLGGALTFVDADAPDVGGLDELKTWLTSRKKAFGSPKAKKFGLPEPKGVLLLGIPGTGKSLTAKTVAKEWGLPLLRLDAGKLFGSLVGQSESQTRQAIEAAEASAPCVLWVDEIEKGLAGSKGGSGDSGTSQRVFGTLLTWLQEKVKPVFIVATANRIADLPPELLRKGRFDEIFFLDLPSTAERREIARIHVERRGRDPKLVSATAIADASEGFSGAEIEQAVIEALFQAYADGRDITSENVINAIRSTMPLSKTMAEEIKALRAWAKGRAKSATSASDEAGTVDKPKRAGITS